jgi:hypothetical protein
MSFETRKEDAEKVLRRWRRSNQSEAAQKRLIDDGERAWGLARDLAEALENLLAHARNVQHGYIAVARRRWPAAEWIIGDGHYASVARCGTVTVMLFATPTEAERAKVLIDRTGCGHACRGEHEITDLATEAAR